MTAHLSRLTTMLFLSVMLAALPRPAGAAPPTPIVPNVIGFWFGYYVSAGGTSGFVSLQIPSQDQRRFQGTFYVVPLEQITPPTPIRVEGTVSRSGEVSLVGRGDAIFLQAHGRVYRGVMQVDYQLMFADGTSDDGTASISIETGNGS